MTEDLEAANARIHTLETLVSVLRHDLRGAVSPASLIADAMLANGDPAIRRSGQRIATMVERVMAAINTTLTVVPPKGSAAR
jgi:hypothetical protein